MHFQKRSRGDLMPKKKNKDIIKEQKEEIAKLKEAAKKKADWKGEGTMPPAKEGKGEIDTSKKQEGTLCPSCLKKGKKVTMTPRGRDNLECSKCNSWMKKPE